MDDSSKPVSPIVGVVVVALCAATIALVCLLPFDSLVVDLVYQGF